MTDFDYDFFVEEAQDEDAIEELKSSKKEKRKSFAAIINKKKLSRYELDEVMV